MSAEPDSAAIFACAHSIWVACEKVRATDVPLDLSEAYNGMDQFMREIMRVAGQFETWACWHLNFNELDEPWPCLLQDHFGDACLQVLSATELASFTDQSCLRVALRMQLPVRLDQGLPVPVDLVASNPSDAGAGGFRAFRIQTVRDNLEDDNSVEAFTAANDPYDPDYGTAYFGLYGAGPDGLWEHIADRPSLAAALTLAEKLVPGLKFTVAADARRL